jgi:hypothetical protein
MQAVEDQMLKILGELMRLPYLKDHYLVGGTNLALRNGHRTSIDLDLFVHKDFDEGYTFRLNQELKETYGDRLDTVSVSEVGVFGFIDDVKVDFVNYPYKLLRPIENVQGARLANTLDIAAMKIKAISSRGSRKDFFDIHELLKSYSLDNIFNAFGKKYSIDHVGQAKMSLGWFEDAEDLGKRDNQFKPLIDFDWEIIKNDIRNAMVQMENDAAIKAAVHFHQNNEYAGKIPNVKAYYPDSALLKSFENATGYRLTKNQLEAVDKIISKDIKKDNGIGY